MPETTEASSQKTAILSGTFGKIGFGAVLLLLIGVFAGMLQVLVLTGQAHLGSGKAQYGPGLVAVILIGGFLLQAFSRGKFQVFPDRITGKKKMGGPFNVAFSEGMQVNLASPSLRIDDSQGKILFLQPNPKPSKVAGLLWMRLQYPWMKDWMELGLLSTPDGNDPRFLSGLKRTFLPEGGTPFHDAGFIAILEGEAWYLPWSDTYQLPQKNTGQSSFRQAITGNEPVLRFSPNPALLPIPEIVFGIMESDWTIERKKEILHELAQSHAGTHFEQFNAKDSEWAGEMEEIPLSIALFKGQNAR